MFIGIIIISTVSFNLRSPLEPSKYTNYELLQCNYILESYGPKVLIQQRKGHLSKQVRMTKHVSPITVHLETSNNHFPSPKLKINGLEPEERETLDLGVYKDWLLLHYPIIAES